MKFYLDQNYYFITCRTLDGKNYFSDDSKKQIILDELLKAEKYFNIKFIAYSILLNHYHLLFHLSKGLDLQKIMQKINGATSFKLKETDKPIWADYHNSNVLDEDSYYRVMGYVIGNPFKHGLVKSIDDLSNYKFCNYKEKLKEYGKEGINEIIANVQNLNWELNLK
jgi:putative transposase